MPAAHDLASAYAACERMSRAHYENFPVASRLLPARMRPHVAAIYAFARAADDLADEGVRSIEERQALLEGWCRRLYHAASEEGPGSPRVDGEPVETLQIFVAIGATIRACRLPLAPFTDLISAFRQDITTVRYDSWASLLDYCRRSANPVGRLVLRVAGYNDDGLDAASDAVCTALQLTNFWQDFGVDFERGRIYLPREVCQTFDAHEEDLNAPRMPLEWRRALASAAARTRALFAAGRPVADRIHGRLRHELRATWLGGVRILDRLAARDYDVLRRRPALGSSDLLWIAWRLLTWGSRAR